VFDGVHRGHQALLAAAREWLTGGKLLWSVTFDPHPRQFFQGRAPLSLIQTLPTAWPNCCVGADRVVAVRFTEAVADPRRRPSLDELLRPRHSDAQTW